MRSFLTIATVVNVLLATLVYSQNTDRFNYRVTSGTDYAPADWNQVSCDTLGQCEGWPDAWVMSPGWTLGELGNQCGQSTNDHPQGPINLERATGISDWANKGYKECIDVHWMKYYNGGCNWEDMVNNPESEFANNFFIRRHALQIMMPLGTDGQIKCPSGKADGTWQGADYDFPKLDYSKGFPEWWRLVQTNIKTPSDYTQDGTQYDAQLTYHMFYELPYPEQSPTGPRKRDGEIVIFMQAYDDVEPDPLIDKLICQFRKTEDQVREDCGLDSVQNRYPGCYNPSRRGGRRNLRRAGTSEGSVNSNVTVQEPAHTYPDTSSIKISKEADLKFEEFLKTFDFDEFIEEQIKMGGGNGNWEGHPYADPERHLLDYLHVPFHHFGALLNVRTEYYHRLVSSQLVPPCQEGVHARVMKDPLRIHPRQLKEIQRLLALRTAPKGSRFNECQWDTAGTSTQGRFGGPSVALNRPLTGRRGLHKMQFCECKDWPSKWPEDRKWCGLGGDEGNESPKGLEPRLRYWEHPYNYYSEEDEEWTALPFSPPTASPAPSSTPTRFNSETASPTLNPTNSSMMCWDKKDYCYGANESSRCCSGECKEDKQECA